MSKGFVAAFLALALIAAIAVLSTTPSTLPPFFGEAANWLSERLGTEPVTMSGGHGPHYDRPEEVAKIIRDLAPID